MQYRHNIQNHSLLIVKQYLALYIADQLPFDTGPLMLKLN